jgi:hypothetical protein
MEEKTMAQMSTVTSTNDSTTTTASTLNPNSPSFAPSHPVGLRPPPGLVHPNGLDSFKNNTSTNYNSQMPSLFLPSPTTTSSAPLSPGLAVPGLTLPSGCTTSSPSSFLHHPRDNPFVDDDEEQIAAELQELGGKMVDGILDF